MTNITKEATRDAREFARAQMYYGEGAGIRRKLIQASVATKVERDPGYNEAFSKALAEQDMSEHAAAARKERRRKDFTHAINQNVANAATGKYTGVNATLILAGIAVYAARKTGYDQVVITKARTKYRNFREKHHAKRAVQKVDATIHRIADYAHPHGPQGPTHVDQA